jgi:hypothetical protein
MAALAALAAGGAGAAAQFAALRPAWQRCVLRARDGPASVHGTSGTSA